jgi:hypothetical protein
MCLSSCALLSTWDRPFTGVAGSVAVIGTVKRRGGAGGRVLVAF